MSRRSYQYYGTGAFPRPHDDIDPKNKDQRWSLEWCKFIFSIGARQDNNTPYSNYDTIEINRQYAEGRQSTDQYLKRFNEEIASQTGTPTSSTDRLSGDDTLNGRSQRRQGYMNVDSKILPVFPKYLSLLIGKYSGMDHDITAEARDQKSGVERQNQKWDTWFESKNRDFLDKYYASIEGEPPSTVDFIPESIQELELFESMGGFKLKHETALETLVGHTFDISDWEMTVKRKMNVDFIANNIACCQDYLDIASNKVKVRYLDPSKLIVPYHTENEYQNPEYHGYVRLFRAAELRLHGIPEDRIRTYAQNFANDYGNSGWDRVTDYESNHSRTSVHDSYAYDEFNIPVLECEWESVDTYYDQYRQNKKGEKLITEEYFDVGQSKYKSGKYENRKDRKINETNIKNRYKASWILDSEDILSYGKIYDTPRPNNEVKSSVHVFRLDGMSIVERCIPTLNQIQIAWLKFQNAVALAAPPGIAVEYDALCNISTGDGNNMFHPLEILKIRSQTGNFIYKVTPMGFGGNTRGNAGKPFEELQGGMGQALDEWNKTFQGHIMTIQQNSGISAAADASNPDPEQSVKGSELALVGTNNTLRPIYDGYLAIKSRVADNSSYKIQLLIQHDRDIYEAYYPVLGKAKLQTLKVADKLAASDFGIKMEARPTNEMKTDIKEQIKIGMQVGKEGQSNLSSANGLMLLNMVENGTSLKLVTAMLQYYEKKDQERLEEIRSANITEQGEQKRQSDEAAAQLKIQELTTANDLEIAKDKASEEEKRKSAHLAHIDKLEELQMIERIRLSNNSSVSEAV